MLNIPEAIYEQELTDWLSQQTHQSVDKFPELPLLLRLSKAQMKERHRSGEYPFIANFRISEEECGALLQYTNSSNIQIQAYCKDVCHMHIKGRGKLSMAASASEDYLSLYAICLSPWFLLRSISVRAYKPLKSEKFIRDIYDILSQKIYPGWIREMCEELKKSYSTEELIPISSLLLKQVSLIQDSPHRDDERSYIDALKEIGCITAQEQHLKKALSYEAELDYVNANKESNTIYPNNVDIIQNAYREIFHIKALYLNEYERIKYKLIKEQQEFNSNLQLYGVKTNITLDNDFITMVDKIIEDANISEPLKVFGLLRGLPFISKVAIEKYCTHSCTQTPFLSMFGSMRLGDQGQIIGIASPEEGVQISAYRYYRLKWRCIIEKTILETIESPNFNENEVCQVLCENCTASYIQPYQVLFWAKGLTCGLKGDLISAAHILTPQIERSLVNKAESIYGDLSALHRDDHQDEPGLSKALEYLKPYFKEDIYNDLRFFLNTGADVNLRNCVAHGLWTPQHFLDNGAYLWWIALKMYFCEDEIFLNSTE